MSQPPTSEMEGHEPTALYRLYGADDALLYIGISAHPRSRLVQHQRQKSWWDEVRRHEVLWLSSRADAFAAETAEITLEGPKYNSVGTARHAEKCRAGYLAYRARVARRRPHLEHFLKLAFAGAPSEEISAELDRAEEIATEAERKYHASQ